MTEKVKLTADQKRQRREERLQERKDNDIRVVLKSPEGRRLYRRLMAEAGIYIEPFVMGYPDATNYNLGRVSVGRQMLADLLRAEPTAFEQMNREYASESKRIEDEDKEIDKEENNLNTAA